MRITMNCPSCPGRLSFSPQPRLSLNQQLSTSCAACGARYRLIGGSLTRDEEVQEAV